MSRIEFDSLIIYRDRHRVASVLLFLVSCALLLPWLDRTFADTGMVVQFVPYSLFVFGCSLAVLFHERAFVIDRTARTLEFIHRRLLRKTIREVYRLDRLSVRVVTVPAHWVGSMHYIKLEVQGRRPIGFLSNGRGEGTLILAREFARDLDAPISEVDRSSR